MGTVQLSLKLAPDYTSTDLNAQVLQVSRDIWVQEQRVDGLFNKIKDNWALVNQVATTSLSLLARATKGTAAGAAVQVAQTGLQIAQTEVAIYRLGVQASAAALAGSFGQAAGFTVLAGMLQGTVIGNLITQSQQQANQRNAEELARQLESYI